MEIDNETKEYIMKTSRIKSIKLVGIRPVVDLTVHKNHTFVTGSRIVVHNCVSTQPALRGFIEDFSNNCRFILTCNFKNKIIEPLHSRCTPVEFGSTNKKQLGGLCVIFLKRLEYILKTEKIEYDQKVLVELIRRYAPDWRRIINEVDRHSRGGVLKTTAVSDEGFDKSIRELIGYLGAKDFKSMRTWCAEHAQLDGVSAFRSIYDSLSKYAEPKSIPSAILVIADYMYKSSFMADKEINMVACMTELMSEIQWKKKS